MIATMEEETPRHRAKALRLMLRRWCFQRPRWSRSTKKDPQQNAVSGAPQRTDPAVDRGEAAETGESVDRIYRDLQKKYDRPSSRFSIFTGIARHVVWFISACTRKRTSGLRTLSVSGRPNEREWPYWCPVIGVIWITS